MRVHALVPRPQPWVAVTKGLVLDEDLVEPLIVTRRKPERRVLEERERHDVRDAEVAVEVVPTLQQLLEDVERGAHARAELGDACRVRLRLLLLGRDEVRRPLPEHVEPVDEELRLRAAGGLLWIERRGRPAPLPPPHHEGGGGAPPLAPPGHARRGGRAGPRPPPPPPGPRA